MTFLYIFLNFYITFVISGVLLSIILKNVPDITGNTRVAKRLINYFGNPVENWIIACFIPLFNIVNLIALVDLYFYTLKNKKIRLKYKKIDPYGEEEWEN